MLSAKPWKLDRVMLLLAGIAFCICFGALLTVLALHISGEQKPDENSMLFIVLGTATIHGSILLVTGLFLWWYHLDWKEVFGFSMPNSRHAILLGLLAAIGFLPIGISLQWFSMQIIDHFHIEASDQQAVVALQSAQSWGSLAYMVVWTILVAPVAEEILFRGILYSAIKQGGFPRAALWVTAFVFSAAHLATSAHPSWSIFLPLFVLGLALAWLYEKTNNLLTSITAHSVFNGINVVLLYFGEDFSQVVTRWLHHS